MQFEAKLAQLMEDENLREKFGSNARESIKKFSNEGICQAFYDFIAS
jgi:glycosyltransferase involved in cell wall biosynthesis